MARNLTNRLWQSFLQLNLYKKPSSTEETTRKELLATRLFVCSLSIAILIIVVTFALIIRTLTGIEYTPSQNRFSQLISKNPYTLYCPCSTIGIPYYTFVSTHVQFHQVCSSIFIQPPWINMIFSQYNTSSSSSSSSNDLRFTLSFFWQLIADFCTISHRTWNSTLTGFEISHLFSPIAIAEHVLQSQVKTTLQNQINQAKTKLAYDLLSIRRLTSGNQIASALTTNYYLRYLPNNTSQWIGPIMSPRTFNDCSCLRVEGCPHSATIQDSYNHEIIIPGMIADCLIIDGTLASTLECYYNQTCFSLLHPSLSLTVQPLSNISNKHFSINSTIEMLLNELMIDVMINDIRFDFYYSKCNPTYCSYSYTKQFDVLYIFTTIIGIFSGLSFLLQFISRYIVIIVLKWKQRRMVNNNNDVSSTTAVQQNKLRMLFVYIRKLPNYVRQTNIDFNLFERETPRTLNNIWRERTLTRIFIILLIISSIAAGFYIFYLPQNQVIIVSQPSIDTYQQLYNSHSDTLQCSCTNMSVSYGSFLNVTFILHQVCSSDFVSSKWLNYLTLFDPIFSPSWVFHRNLGDFRQIGLSYFQLLSTFCSLAKINIKNAEHVFLNTHFVNAYVLAPSLFEQQTTTMIESYISGTRNDFNHTLNWIKIAFIINSLLTGVNTNFDITIRNNRTLVMNNLYYATPCQLNHTGFMCTGGCACPTESLTCFGYDLIYTNGSNVFDYEQIFNELPFGCIPLTGFLSSTFAWWYNEIYLENIQNSYAVVIQSQSLPNIESLSTFVSTRFGTNSLQYLLQEMFIETSIKSTDFNQFYNVCAPKSCSYTVVQRRSVIVALLLLISICGSLSKLLQIFTRAFGKMIFFFIDWYHNRAVHQPIPRITTRISHLFRAIYQSLINMNLYKKISETNEIMIKQQKIFTEIYLILFISCLSIILFYTAIIQRTLTKTYQISTTTDYEHLLDAYSNDINCPCTHISIPYDNLFTELKVNQFHQACTTKTVASALLSGVRYEDGKVYATQDFRSLQSSFINGLQQLCTLAQQSINNNIILFLASTIFVNQLMSRQQFYDQMNITLNRFKQKLPNEFARTLDAIRTNTQGNALIGVFSTNWQFILDDQSHETNISYYSQSLTYFDTNQNISCVCATSKYCTMSAQILYDNGTVKYIIEGLKLGCYPLETILLSSLSCFYSTICLYNMRRALGVRVQTLELEKNGTGIVKPFNSSLTQFNINDTIETLAYAMFIESWISNVSYERFFNNCAATYCTYNLYYRFDALELLTMFLAVYAGLSVVIHFIVPVIFKMSKKIYNHIRITPLQQS